MAEPNEKRRSRVPEAREAAREANPDQHPWRYFDCAADLILDKEPMLPAVRTALDESIADSCMRH
jgi:hypothetical protein